MAGLTVLAMMMQAATVGPSAGAAADCAESTTEIVVCAKPADPTRYRLPALPVVPEQQSILPPADFKLFGAARGSFTADQRSVGGFTAPAIMANIKIPF